MRVRCRETEELVCGPPGSVRMKIQRMEIQSLCCIDSVNVPAHRVFYQKADWGRRSEEKRPWYTQREPSHITKQKLFPPQTQKSHREDVGPNWLQWLLKASRSGLWFSCWAPCGQKVVLLHCPLPQGSQKAEPFVSRLQSSSKAPLHTRGQTQGFVTHSITWCQQINSYN